jgi:cobalt-zinc-cadmium efflux system membrane fusion protein
VQVAEATRKEVLTVADGAVQNVGGEDVVFVRVAGGFVVQPAKLGISDALRVESLDGLHVTIKQIEPPSTPQSCAPIV